MTRAAPPADAGTPVLTLRRGRDRELRVRVQTYEGHRFVDLAAWERNARGEWWPARRRGVTVRVGELRAVGEALLRLAAEGAGG